jgi:hypothetical protein
VRRSPRDLDLALAGMVLEKNGEIVSTPAGPRCRARRSTRWPGWPTRWAAWASRSRRAT